MSFFDHLEDLRWHIIRSVIAMAVVSTFGFLYTKEILDGVVFGPTNASFPTYRALCAMGHWLNMGDKLCLTPAQPAFQNHMMAGQVMLQFKLAFTLGIVAAFPYIFWEFWRFVKPALSTREIKSTRGSIFFVTFFFLLGISFGYFLLAPFTFSFLSNYQLGVSHMLITRPTLDDYLDNLLDILIGSGIAFQLPLISYVLTQIGLITPAFLRTYRKYAYVAILFVAAVITPSPDWMSQTIVALPLILLYEISIRISVRVEKELKRKDEEFDRS